MQDADSLRPTCDCDDVDVYCSRRWEMAERLHRTQILLEPEQHRALTAIAQGEGRSVSDLVREIVAQQLEQLKNAINADQKRHLEALERIRAFREAILAERGGQPIDIDVVEMINQMREERDARNLA